MLASKYVLNVVRNNFELLYVEKRGGGNLFFHFYFIYLTHIIGFFISLAS